MKRIKLSIFAIFLIFSNAALWSQNQPKFRMVGGARSVINNQEIDVKDSIADKTTPKAKTGGYSLIDLGFNIMPNKQTEILGMIRIKNQYGGFFGGGVSFDVRQLWVKGIIADVVRYQLGDINIKQTPFTLYNHNEDLIKNQGPLNQIFQDIANYESFYKQNTWRQQGLSVDFGLNFAKGIDELNINGYLTRLNMTNFANTPERLLGGSTIDMVINPNLSVQYNISSVFDVTGTAADSNSFRNIVQTGALKYNQTLKTHLLEFKTEFGNSYNYFTTDKKSPTLYDYFYNPTLKYTNSKKRLNITVGYLNVGPYFRSPGAQSKRIDYQAVLSQFPLYRQYQNERPIHLQDILSDDRLYKTSISSKLMAYNPIINNVLPYGLATFNRKGFYILGSLKNKAENSEIQFSQYQLNEILGQGTSALKSYSMSQLQFNLSVSSILKLSKELKFTSTLLLQHTKRSGSYDFETVDLQSLQIASGLEWEFIKDFHFILGYNYLSGKGNDMISERNIYSEVIDFIKFNSQIEQSIWGTGLKFKFSKTTYLAFLYQMFHHNNKQNQFENYQMNQSNIIYNLTF